MNILVHGFNVKNPMKTVGKLKGFVKNTYLFDYGWFGLMSVLMYNKREAKRLKKIIDKDCGSNVIAHSNGCAIAVEAARRGAKIETLICIAPALKVDTVFPKSINKIVVVHSKGDKPTKAASFFDRIPIIQLLIPNAWGAMGAKGSVIDDDRVSNVDVSNLGHSDLFRNKSIKRCADIVNRGIN